MNKPLSANRLTAPPIERDAPISIERKAIESEQGSLTNIVGIGQKVHEKLGFK